ncbi:MAG TPA: hypothetical protein VF474_13540 [Phenylobacterium sp.]
MAELKDDQLEGETPIQRALRLKKASQAKGGPPGQRVEGERAAAARSQSKSKPWMKR